MFLALSVFAYVRECRVDLGKGRNRALRTFSVPFHDFKHGILGETEVPGYPAV